MDISRTPAYNLKVIVKETGVSPDVLRAWERRYGLPIPERTPGGHRLYSDFDIETVKWLVARQKEGMSISRAVDLWNDTISQGRDPLVEARTPVSTTPVSFPAGVANLESLRKRWLEACLDFDEERAEQILNQAFAMFSVETVCSELLQRGLFEIGEGWHRGEISVQQEHFSTGLVMRRLEMLISSAPRPSRKQTVLIACPPEEWHTFTPLLLTLLLRRRGLRVVYLGANVPIERLEESALIVKPDLITLAAQQLTTAATLRRMTEKLSLHGFPVTFGGSIFNRIPELRTRIQGFFLGEDLDTGVETIERLVTIPFPETTAAYTASEMLKVSESFRAKRSQIETHILEEMMDTGVSLPHIWTANHFFGNELNAALELGDASYLAHDLQWINNLLAQQKINADQLAPYLLSYAQVTRKVMGDNGRLISSWIEKFVTENLNSNLIY